MSGVGLLEPGRLSPVTDGFSFWRLLLPVCYQEP